MFNRRIFVRLARSGAAALGIALAFAPAPRAQTIDTLKLFIPAAPGGGWDQTGRSMEQAIKAAGIAKNVQFEHAPGAGGTVGLPRFLNTMKGQPNTLMVGGMVMVGAIIANKTPVNLTQTLPVARLTGEFQVAVVPAQSPIKTMAELVAALKADPGKVSWAGGSAGGVDHIMVGMIVQALGIDPRKMNYVAYAGGGPAQAALLGNHVSAGVSGWGEFAEQIKAGKLRALGLSSDRRIPGIDVPTLKEAGVDVELFNWRGVFAPPGITDQQRQALTAAVEAMAKSPAWQEELKKRDWTGIYLSGQAFEDYIKSETSRIEGVLKNLGLAS
ncbi:MAG: Bug family tripartite tricarboxylate transporter substrate binding protein [Pseudomonadota bacterium]